MNEVEVENVWLQLGGTVCVDEPVAEPPAVTMISLDAEDCAREHTVLIRLCDGHTPRWARFSDTDGCERAVGEVDVVVGGGVVHGHSHVADTASGQELAAEKVHVADAGVKYSSDWETVKVVCGV